MALLAEIMDSSDFAEVCFLIAVILFAIEVVRLIAVREASWGYHWVLVVAGLLFIALGFLALPTDTTPDAAGVVSVLTAR